MGRFPILQKKERWTLTWRGRLLQLFAIALLVLVYAKTIVPFLSPDAPVRADLLVVEGYVPDYALEEAMEIFHGQGYNHLVITGKKREKGAPLDQYANDGEYSAATLEKMGFDPSLMTVVATGDDVQKDRTYYSARAVRDWMDKHRPQDNSIDLVSMGTHSRRSRLLFEKAFGDDCKVGIISVANRSYDPDRWWKSSQGFREVNKETIAWVYARFFFWP